MDVGFDIYNGKVGGSIAARVAAGCFHVNQMRTNALLLKDEWQLLDSKIVEVARPRLRGVADLLTRGLKTTVNGMQITVLQWQTQSRTSDVTTSMSPQVSGNNETVRFDLTGVPLPIFSADYQFDARFLGVSRNQGQPLDTTMAMQKSIDIAEKVENTYVNGLGSYTFDGVSVFGLTDHPNRKTATLGTSWADVSVTGQDILDQVLELKQDLIDSQKHGPYVLYIPTAYETKMDSDFKADGDKTIRERLLDIDNLEAVTVLDKLAIDNVVLVQLTSDCVDMIEGMPLTNVAWDEKGGMTEHFKIMTIMIPRFFVDQDGNIGIAHLS